MNGLVAAAAAAAAASAAAGSLGQEEESLHRATDSTCTSPRPVLPPSHPHPHPHQRRPRSILRHPPSSSNSGPSCSSSSTSASASASAHRHRRRPTKTLTFHPRISGRRIDCLSDLGPEMVQTLWYTDADQAALAKEVVSSIRYMRSRQGQQRSQQSRSGGGDDADDDARPDNDDDDEEEEEEGEENFCTRGLEHMLNGRTLAEQSRAKNAALAAVLDEQRLQRLRARAGRRAACGGGEQQQQQVAHHAHAPAPASYGPVCPTTLAAVAAAASRRHLEVALMRAAEDAAAVRRYLRREGGRDVVQRALEIEGRASSVSASAPPGATAVSSSSSSSSSAAAASNQHQHQNKPAAAAAAPTSSYLNTKRRLSARSLAGPAPVTTMTPHSSSSVLGGTLSLREESRRSSFLQQFAANGAGAGAGAGAAGTTLPRTTAPAPTTNTAGTFAGMPTFHPGSVLSVTTSQAGIGRGQPMMKRRRSDGFLSASATSLFAAYAQPPPVVPSPNEATSTEEVLPSAGPTAVAGGSSSESTPTATPLGNHIGSTVTPTTTSLSDLHIGGGYLSS